MSLVLLLLGLAQAGWEPAPLDMDGKTVYGKLRLEPEDSATLVLPAASALRLTGRTAPRVEDVGGALQVELGLEQISEEQWVLPATLHKRTLRISSGAFLSLRVEVGLDEIEAATWSRLEDALSRQLDLGRRPKGDPLLRLDSSRARGVYAEANTLRSDLLEAGTELHLAEKLAVAAATLRLEGLRSLARADHGLRPLPAPGPTDPAAPEGGGFLPANEDWALDVEGPAVVEWELRLPVPTDSIAATISIWGDGLLQRRTLVRTVGAEVPPEKVWSFFPKPPGEPVPRLSATGVPVSISQKYRVVVPPGSHTLLLRADADLFGAARLWIRRKPLAEPLGVLTNATGGIAEVFRRSLLWDHAGARRAMEALSLPVSDSPLVTTLRVSLGLEVPAALPENHVPTALALLARWDRERAIDAALLLPYTSLLARHGDPAAFGRWLDALNPPPLRSRGLAALQAMGAADRAEALLSLADWTLWATAPMADPNVPLRWQVEEGPGPGQRQRSLEAGTIVLLKMPAVGPGRVPLLRLASDGPARFLLNGLPYVVDESLVGLPLEIGLEPGDHSLRVQEGHLRLVDPEVAPEAGRTVRLLSYAPLPARWVVPGAEWGTEVLLRLSGGPGDAELDLGPGGKRRIHLDGEEGMINLEIPAGSSVISLRGDSHLQAHLAWRRPISELPPGWELPASPLLPTAEEGDDPVRQTTDDLLESVSSLTSAPIEQQLACLRSLSTALDGRSGPAACVVPEKVSEILLLRSTLLSALGQTGAARRDLQRVLADPASSPEARVRARTLLTAPWIPSSSSPGAVSPAAAYAGAELSGPITAEGLTSIGAWLPAGVLELETGRPLMALLNSLQAGDAGAELRSRALAQVGWMSVPFLAEGAGTRREERERSLPPSLPGQIREAMLGLTWTPGDYLVLRDDLRSNTELPARGGSTVELVCRDEQAGAEAPTPCVVPVVEDGVQSTLEVPEGQVFRISSRARWLRVGPVGPGHAVAVRVEQGGKAVRARMVVDAWAVAPRRPLRFTLAAPGVVQVLKLSGEGTPYALVDNVQVPGVQVGDAWLVPVVGKGPVSVTVLTDAPATVSLSVALPEPAIRLKEAKTAANTPSAASSSTAADPFADTLLPGRRPQLPTRGTAPTVYGELSRVDRVTGRLPSHDRYTGLNAGVTRRFDGLPLWGMAELSGRMRSGPATVGLSTRALYQADPLELTANLSAFWQPGLGAWTGKLRLGSRAFLRAHPLLDLIPGIESNVVITGSPDGQGVVDPDAWNSFSASHPFSLRPTVAARLLPAREARVEALVGLTTNPAPWSPDSLDATFSGRLLLPPWILLGASAGIKGWIQDDNRSESWWDMKFEGSAGWYPWIDRRNRIGIGASLGWLPVRASLQGGIELSYWWSDERALDDLLPDTLPFSSSLEWRP
jgi:hypothetical protein